MELTISGIKFDLEPLESPFDPQIGTTHFASEISRQQVYFWNCRPPNPQGRFVARLTSDGRLNVPNIIAFRELDRPAPFGAVDQTKTAQMKIDVLTGLRLQSINDLATAINRVFGKHSFKIDVSPFDWLKPFASYAVWADIHYHYFEAENTTRNLRFFIGLPHEIRLTADITFLCDATGLKKAIAGGETLDPVSGGLAEGGNARSKGARRRFLRQRLRWLRSIQEPFMPLPEHFREEIDKINRELKELESD